jgi:SAM-dependent methyltransferase
VSTGDASDPRRRPESFDTVADQYARYRRGYPPEVVADLAGGCGIGPGTRVLEIGCGTGQLSVPVARLGAELVAVELGPALAERAREVLGPFPAAQVVTAAFESWPLPDEPFDAVVSANAFHWLDPSSRIERCLAALRPGGALGVVQPHFVADGSGFVSDSQQCYLRWGLSDDPAFTLPPANEVPPAYPELDADARFAGVSRRRHVADRRYTAAEWVGLLTTDSLVLGLGEAERKGFLSDIGDLVDSRYAGAITRRFLYEVIVARSAGD